MTFINFILSNLNSSECVSMNNQECKCRLDASVCSNKQNWNKGKCRCECNELIHKRMCDKEFIWNPSNCECECDNVCDV